MKSFEIAAANMKLFMKLTAWRHRRHSIGM